MVDLILTYEEHDEIRAQYNKLAKIQMEEPPDTTEFDAWMAKRHGTTKPWRELRIHVVPTVEHKEKYAKEAART